ncbi:MAG: hypothetical protein IPG76_22500 [Acidobacteria bacterium]|nr:hypothetical protein [Acidobacteriota bacterium]
MRTFEEAKETASAIEDAWSKARALMAIAKAQAEAGERNAAMSTSKRRRRRPRQLKIIKVRPMRWREIAKAQEGLGRRVPQ